MKWPGNIKTGSLVKKPAIAMDLTTSMLDAAGRDNAMKTLDGITLFPIIDEPKTAAQRQLFWQHGRMKAVREGNWKYVIDNHSEILINLEADISERKNLFYQHPKKVKELKESLTDWEQTLENIKEEDI